jgi:cell wall-associated NlpC family hydrolase
LLLLSPLASAANHEKTVAVEEPQPAAPLQLQKDLAGEEVPQAMSLTGIAYRFGGQSPATGFDRSGLIRFVFLKSVGYELPERRQQARR